MLYYFKKGKITTEMKKETCTVYGEDSVTYQQACQKQLVTLPAGAFSLDNAPRSIKPVEVDSNQIETLIDNNQHSTTWEILDTPKISK